MELIICFLSACVGVATFVASWFYCKPIQATINGFKDSLTANFNALQKTMEKLAEAVDGLRRENTSIQVHVKEIEQIAKSAQKRCDDLAERVHEVEQRCINCTCRKE